jgi:hypothetical protein
MPAAPVWGVTVDTVDHLDALTDSLAHLPVRPTTRVVFDRVPASTYVAPVHAIHRVSDVMGEILDSYYVHAYDGDAYVARAKSYLDTLGDDVDIWEIGNEFNGEWLCAKNAGLCSPARTHELVDALTRTFELVRDRQKKTELTLYLNEGCYSDPKNELFTWVDANMSQELENGLDRVLLSYYEDDCNGRQPDWTSVIRRLGERFPNAELGVGECGTTHPNEKASFVRRYYAMQIDHPRYVGGYFWWYFAEDMVPRTAPLFGVLDEAIAKSAH